MFFPHRCVNPDTGYVTVCDPHTEADYFVNMEPVRVRAGTILRWRNTETAGRIFFYGTDIRESWVHTFCYEPESNWAVYDPEKTETEWSSRNRIFDRDGYIRIVIRVPADEAGKGNKDEDPDPGHILSACTEYAKSIFALEHPAETLSEEACIHPFFRREAGRVLERLSAVREPEDLVFFLLADTHYAVNGNWEDTAKNVKYMARLCHPDFAVHLGDLTDGLLPSALTKQYSGRILDALHEAAGPVYCCLGNHDSNYAGNNPERFTKEESAAWYLQYAEGTSGVHIPCNAENKKEDFYFVDDIRRQLRMIFLASFDCERDTENDRYGYSEEESRWLKEVLQSTPEGFGVLVFSHVPLLPEMHVWSDGIRGSENILQLLEEFQQKRQALLAFFHGHNHCDQIERKYSFPIVSIGCSKLESFPEKKPAGAVCYHRERGTVTQDLWDVVRVSRNHGTIDLIRFGAGKTGEYKLEESAFIF